MFAAVMSALLLAGTDPAPSTPVSNSPNAASQDAKASKAPELACWDEKPTGSHMIKRICATKEQLEKAQRDGQDAVSSDHRSARTGLSPK